MPWIDAFAPVKRRACMREAWGHLAPEPQRVYSGYIIFTLTDWGDYTPIESEFVGLDDSPWFFEDMMEFIVRKAKKQGVYRFTGTYQRLKNGKGRFSGKVEKVHLRG